MAKRKTKRVQADDKDYSELRLAAGVLIQILPFPIGMFESINEKVIVSNPYPDPPEKEITVLGGKTETIKDVDDPDYMSKIARIDKVRETQMSQLILEYILYDCINIIEPSDVQSEIKRLSRFVEFPDDPNECVIKYLTSHAIRTKGEYSEIITRSLELSVVSDEEVANRLTSFQRDLERSVVAGPETPSPIEAEQMEMDKSV